MVLQAYRQDYALPSIWPSAALKAGYAVTFARADKLFSHLRLSAIDGTFERTIRSYIRPDILIIDDFAVREMSKGRSGAFL
ncbi:MAG: ATP-binding protein [Actinomycetota bacterium]|nr:ATP-binding protein [Actinomycetota bacterium]